MLDRMIIGMHLALLAAVDRTFGKPEQPDQNRRDRGDVPGWVMITVMTAIVVVALLVVFQDEITKAVKNAFTKVNGSGKD